jgi:DNA invertase Pin-like site-specific DNA recombinase
MATGKVDDFTGRMFEAINGMLLDMLAAIARKDYEDRRRRQFQGPERVKAEGRYRGRPENKKRNKRIADMLAFRFSKYLQLGVLDVDSFDSINHAH